MTQSNFIEQLESRQLLSAVTTATASFSGSTLTIKGLKNTALNVTVVPETTAADVNGNTTATGNLLITFSGTDIPTTVGKGLILVANPPAGTFQEILPAGAAGVGKLKTIKVTGSKVADSVQVDIGTTIQSGGNASAIPAVAPTATHATVATKNNAKLKAIINTQAGADTITGGDQIDQINAGDDNDTVVGSGGKDVVHGGNGDDSINYGSVLVGGVPTPVNSDGVKIFGDSGNDSVIGGSGNDSLDGGSGDDSLAGGGGADKITGGSGNDTLNGGPDAGDVADSDTLKGNSGSDTFISDSNDKVFTDKNDVV